MKKETMHTVEVALPDRVRVLVEEVLAATPHFVVDVDVRGTRGSRSVQVFVDSDATLDAHALGQISRDLGFLIDTEEVIDGGYTLTVSTPGVDRPLRMPRQYRKNVGRPLRVHHRRAEGEGNTETTGTLAAADDDGIELALEKGQTHRIPYTDILWAKVQLPW